MIYRDEQVVDLIRQQAALLDGLELMFLSICEHGREAEDERTRAHMLHGAGRRVKVMRRAIENIFTLFPLWQDRPLPSAVLTDTQINLHAFVINLYGIFDNFAWAFVIRHRLETHIRNYRRIGLFKEETQRFLPAALREYIESKPVVDWYENYLTNYRDALAHRIPLYIPPYTLTVEEGDSYNRLKAEEFECIRTGCFERLEAVRSEQAALGNPSPIFLHTFAEGEASIPLWLHPQLLSDGNTIVDFGTRFLAGWHERAA